MEGKCLRETFTGTFPAYCFNRDRSEVNLTSIVLNHSNDDDDDVDVGNLNEVGNDRSLGRKTTSILFPILRIFGCSRRRRRNQPTSCPSKK